MRPLADEEAHFYGEPRHRFLRPAPFACFFNSLLTGDIDARGWDPRGIDVADVTQPNGARQVERPMSDSKTGMDVSPTSRHKTHRFRPMRDRIISLNKPPGS